MRLTPIESRVILLDMAEGGVTSEIPVSLPIDDRWSERKQNIARIKEIVEQVGGDGKVLRESLTDPKGSSTLYD